MRRLLLLLALGVFVLGLSAYLLWRQNSWPGAVAFRNSLRCGMTPGQVVKLADLYHASFGMSADGAYKERASVGNGRTAFHLTFQRGSASSWMDGSHLEAVRRASYYGFTGVDLGPWQQLCGASRHVAPSPNTPEASDAR
jgi:hypothetical protein